MDYLPVFADVRGRAVLVVGGGSVAARKTEMLLKAGAKVRVAAARLNAQMQEWLQQKRIEHVAAQFDETLLDKVFLAVAATNDAALNRAVFAAGEARCRLVNVVDEQELCSFIVPALIDRSPVQIAVSTGGTAPVLARRLREKLETLLPQHLGNAAQTAARWRTRVKAALPEVSRRRRFWETLLDDAAFDRAAATGGDTDAVVAAHLANAPAPRGEVVLVGAGPGDAGLLTLKGLQALQEADVVLYDALVSPDVLELVRRDADKICVGKRAGRHSVAQDETNRLLLEHAQQGKRVVRLKGGDPFVFGRGGEELTVLRQAGIPFRVVPGITAALGATAYAGIALTHRDLAQTAVFVTGHCRADGDELDWSALARSHQTLAVYMGTVKAAHLREQLLAHGRRADTPVAVISHGTLPTQQVQTGVLDDLPKLAACARAPALMVIGETVALHAHLRWFGSQEDKT